MLKYNLTSLRLEITKVHAYILKNKNNFLHCKGNIHFLTIRKYINKSKSKVKKQSQSEICIFWCISFALFIMCWYRTSIKWYYSLRVVLYHDFLFWNDFKVTVILKGLYKELPKPTIWRFYSIFGNCTNKCYSYKMAILDIDVILSCHVFSVSPSFWESPSVLSFMT